MSSYFSYLLRPHMIIILVAIVVLAASGTWLLRNRLKTRSRLFLFFATVISVGGLLQVTLLREESWGLFFDHIFIWDTDSLMRGIIGTDTLLNIVLFVPAGLFATLLWKHPFRITGCAILVSTLIECLQAIFGVGSNSVLDILANSLGALVGSWLGWAFYLFYDWIKTRRIEVVPLIKLFTTAVVLIGICFGGSALGAGLRQESLVKDLEREFAGTTLQDYKEWDAAEDLMKVYERGFSWPDGYSDDSVAVVRFPTGLYFMQSCVIATWTERGFSILRLSSSDCAKRLP